MSESTKPGSSDEPAFRYTARMAGRIEESAARCDEAAALGALADSVNSVMLTLTQRWVRLRVEGRLSEAAAVMEEHGPPIFGQLAGTYASSRRPDTTAIG